MARTEGSTYALANAPTHGQIVNPSDVETGNWHLAARTFTAGGEPLNAVQVTAYRTTDRGNPLPATLALAFGLDSFDIVTRAVAIQRGGGGTTDTTQFLVDAEMIDSDVPSIEALAASLGMSPDDIISDLNGDGYIDLPPGEVLDVPTGQVGDSALFELGEAFPFTDSSTPSFQDFLDYNENGTWRQELLEDHHLDPLPGPTPVEDAADYDQFVGQGCQVSPVWKSDVSTLNPLEQGLDSVDGEGTPAVNAKGERRGLLAFEILAILEDPDGPGGSALPDIRIRVCEPVDTSGVSPAGPGGPAAGGGASALVASARTGPVSSGFSLLFSALAIDS